MLNTSVHARSRAVSIRQPVRCSATGFMNTIRPRTSVAMTASPMLSSVVSNHSRCSAIASSARRCSVKSRNTSTTPRMRPASSRMGAALSAMGRSVPSRLISTVWLARPRMWPDRMTSPAGFSTGCRVVSFTIWKTSASGIPCALSFVHPVSVSAMPFMYVTRPSASEAMIPSPMLRERHAEPFLLRGQRGGGPFALGDVTRDLRDADDRA